MSDALDDFEMAVLEEAWLYVLRLEDDMGLAIKIERAVKQGITPKALSMKFLQVAGSHREPMAKRIENAARFVQLQQGK